MVVLFIDPAADSKHEERLRRHQQMILQGRDSGIDHDQAEVANKKINRIREEEALDLGAEGVNRIKDRRYVHQQLGKHTPKVLNIPEENKQSRENHSCTGVKQHQKTDRVQQADEAPCERDAIQDAENEEHAERQPEVNQALDVFGEQEQVFWYIDLGKNVRVAQ